MPANVLSETPLWEKIAGFIGFLLILIMLGYLGWSASSNGDAPPQIEFEIVDIQMLPNNHLVRVIVRNRGGQVAMSLNIEARLQVVDDDPEQSTALVDYLAIESQQEIGFYFKSNPAAGELTFRALNFQVP